MHLRYENGDNISGSLKNVFVSGIEEPHYQLVVNARHKLEYSDSL